MSRIVMIAPYGELSELTRRLCAEMGIEVMVVEGLLDEAAQAAKALSTEGVEVIISRGGTAEAIREAVDVPVVAANATGMDVLYALYRARNLGAGDRIAATTYETIPYDFDAMEEILGIDIVPIPFKSKDDLIRRVYAARDNGITTIVGGGATVRLAEKLGMHGVLVRTGRETVMQAIQRARELDLARRQERERREHLKAILDSTDDGIISTDRRGQVTVANKAAGMMLGLPVSSLVGRQIGEIIPAMFSHGRDSGRGPELCKLHKDADSDVLATRVPVKVDGEVVGAVVTLQEVGKIQRAEQRIRFQLHTRGLVAKHHFNDIVGQSEAITTAINKARRFSEVDSTILILGETGTGKELFAQSIHNESRRRFGPFVAVNCAALPETLLESELFGYEDGAFTGARRGGKAGLFEVAHQGTLFLDEIGQIPDRVQSQLLRVLEQREVRRIGGDRIIPVDVRLICATNADLPNLVEQGLFRRDLFFRLDVLRLSLPPLRHRPEDIKPLVDSFILQFSSELGRPIPFPNPEEMRLLERYAWPGNVRELRNVIERYCVLASDTANAGEASQVFADLETRSTVSDSATNGQYASVYSSDSGAIVVRAGTLAEMEEQILRAMLRISPSRQELAHRLGISRTTLWKKLKQLQLS